MRSPRERRTFKRRLAAFSNVAELKKMLRLETGEDGKSGKLLERTGPIPEFKLSFLDESQGFSKVEVRSVNFEDLMWHLQRGESFIIALKFLGNCLKQRHFGALFTFAQLGGRCDCWGQ